MCRRTHSISSPSSVPIFSFTLSVNHIIRIIGLVCYQPDIRMRVLELLYKWPQQDGFFDSRIDAFLIESKMKFSKTMIQRVLEQDPDGCPCQGEAFTCDKHKFSRYRIEFPRPGYMTLEAGSSAQLEQDLPWEMYTLELVT